MIEVVVWLERRDGGTLSESFSLLEVGRNLASAREVPLITWGLGAANSDELALLGAFGVTEHVEVALPGTSLMDRARDLVSILGARGPRVVLCGNRPATRESLAWAAGRLGMPIVMDVESLGAHEMRRLKVQKPLPTGQRVTLELEDSQGALIGVCPGRAVRPTDQGVPPQVTRFAGQVLSDALRIEGRVPPPHTRRNLEGASIVVAGGMGMKGSDGLDVLASLASALDGALGGTRPVVDLGLLPPECQIGQTGRTVHPEVYWAFGISGASHHLAGIRGSGCIVAVNSDPSAPIFEECDYGIVGDAQEVARALLSARMATRGNS